MYVLGVILVRIFPHSDWISPYSVRMRENTDQNNSEYGYFLRSDHHLVAYDFPWTIQTDCLHSFLTCLRLCINLNQMCDEYYHQYSWQYLTNICQKTYRKSLYWKEECLILTLPEFDILYEHRGCKNLVFLFLVFFL